MKQILVLKSLGISFPGVRECAVVSEWPIILLLYRRHHAYVQHQSKAHVWDWDGPAASLIAPIPTTCVTCVPPNPFGLWVPLLFRRIGMSTSINFQLWLCAGAAPPHPSAGHCCCYLPPCTAVGWRCKKIFELATSVVRLSGQAHNASPFSRAYWF